MAKRKCNSCGLMREDVGGKECPNGHWMCKGCSYSGKVGMERTTCNVCGELLKK
ncbi:MAG: hypothetical protein NTV30_08025 [Chloroflexi bacterium]|nr:hypothetical protein [Chloroflexota bacterium]